MAGIKLLKRADIDSAAWDKTVTASSRPFVYAMSWYLDAICDGKWEALVLGDYQAVFPLPVKRRWGLSLVYQPFFCQQLGLFKASGQTAGYQEFLRAIPRRFIKVYLQLNTGAPLPGDLPVKTNMLLPLQSDYSGLRSAYSKDALKNLAKTNPEELDFREDASPGEIIDIYRETWGSVNPHVLPEHYHRFESACREAAARDNLLSLVVSGPGGLLAGALFLRNHHYLHYVCAAPTEEGKKTGIMHTVLDHVIRQFAGKPMLLDFEGSEIPGVASFYRKFNPVEEKYGIYRRGLPF